jgi:hypothetical protein
MTLNYKEVYKLCHKMTNKIESNLKKMFDIMKISQSICEMNKFLGHELNILNEFSEMSQSFNKFEVNNYEKNLKFCKISYRRI